jgi:hypothetical protein
MSGWGRSPAAAAPPVSVQARVAVRTSRTPSRQCGKRPFSGGPAGSRRFNESGWRLATASLQDSPT